MLSTVDSIHNQSLHLYNAGHVFQLGRQQVNEVVIFYGHTCTIEPVVWERSFEMFVLSTEDNKTELLKIN